MFESFIGAGLGAVAGVLITMYFADRASIELNKQTKELHLSLANSINALRDGGPFEVRTMPDGSLTVVKFAKTRPDKLEFEGYPPTSKLSNGTNKKD